MAEPQRDAARLLAWTLDLDVSALRAAPERPLEEPARRRFDAAIQARAARRPLSHIVGRRAFWRRDFFIDGRALDPRPESEALVERALARFGRNAAFRVLDLGVGSGALLLSVLDERPKARGLGVDLSADALAVARENRDAFGLAARADLAQGDWTRALAPGASFDLVLCNPPYIPSDALAGLEPEVRLFEPTIALSPGADGLAAYRSIAGRLGPALAPGGLALFECGAGQAAAVRALFTSAGQVGGSAQVGGNGAATSFAAEIFHDLGGAERGVAVSQSMGMQQSARGGPVSP